MSALIQYQLKNYFRSYQFIPPFLIFLIWIIIQYLYSGQPILSSYASSCSVLLFISCWLTINILNLESLNEKYILFIQLESKTFYLVGKWLFIFLVNCVLIIFSIIYPILLHSFKSHISFKQIFIALILHLIVCTLGILISTLIMNINAISQKYKLLLIALIILTSLIKPFLIQSYPFVQYILWILPPIGDFMTLYNSDAPDNYEFLQFTTIIIIYGIVLLVLNLIIFLKSEQK